MHVIHIITSPTGGGAELLVRELNKKLPEYGISSTAIFLTNKDQTELSENEISFDLSSVRSPLAPFKIQKYLRKYSPECTIVHCHLTYPLYYLSMPSIANHFLKIYTEHNTYNKRRKVSLLRPLEKVIYKQYDKIICISQATHSMLLQWIGNEFSYCADVINNGARLFDFKASRVRDSDGVRLVSVGSLTQQKGFDIALQAVSKVQCPVSRYVIIGKGAEKEWLEKQAASLGLSDVVNFVGWCDDIESWLHESDLMLIPSRWEGFGLVSVEGLSSGLPLVASNVPGLNEILNDLDAARLVEPGNPSSMAEAIDSLWSQYNQLDQLAIEARKRAEMYSLDVMTQEYAKAYHEVLSQNLIMNASK